MDSDCVDCDETETENETAAVASFIAARLARLIPEGHRRLIIWGRFKADCSAQGTLGLERASELMQLFLLKADSGCAEKLDYGAVSCILC